MGELSRRWEKLHAVPKVLRRLSTVRLSPSPPRPPTLPDAPSSDEEPESEDPAERAAARAKQLAEGRRLVRDSRGVSVRIRAAEQERDRVARNVAKDAEADKARQGSSWPHYVRYSPR